MSKILKMSSLTIDHMIRSSFDFETYSKIPRILSTSRSRSDVAVSLEVSENADVDEKFDIILNLLMECLDILNAKKPRNTFDINKQMSVNNLDI